MNEARIEALERQIAELKGQIAMVQSTLDSLPPWWGLLTNYRDGDKPRWVHEMDGEWIDGKFVVTAFRAVPTGELHPGIPQGTP